MEFLGKENYHVYTSNLTLLQTYTRLERDTGSMVSLEFLQAILESGIEMLYNTKAELLSAYRLLKNTQRKQIGLTEIINADLMEKHSISFILTFDSWNNLIGTKVSDLLNP